MTNRSLTSEKKEIIYHELIPRIHALIEGEQDWIAILSSIACELHQAFPYFHWTGFYRVTKPEMLKVGPYQGGHGCLSIPFDKGVCGYAARHKKTIRLDNVHDFSDHIACSSSTISEIVIPILDTKGDVKAVLDVDSDDAKAFCQVDETHLCKLCQHLSLYAPSH